VHSQDFLSLTSSGYDHHSSHHGDYLTKRKERSRGLLTVNHQPYRDLGVWQRIKPLILEFWCILSGNTRPRKYVSYYHDAQE
jgi:hypothetical protein